MTTVTSKDGTTIAYTVAGRGPAVILVDGALCHRAFGPMAGIAKLLEPHFTVYTYDRRGRGESGSTLPYAPEREVEDLAALVESAGGSASLVGISSGAALALRAAASGLAIPKLVTYEAPYMVSSARTPPDDMVGHLDAFIAASDRPGALRYFMVDMIGVPAVAMIFMRLMRKAWRQLQDAAPTLPNDARVMGGDFKPDLKSFATITAPALVLRGGRAPQWMTDGNELLAKTLPRSTYKVLPKQTHQVKARVIAPEIIAFLGG